MALTSVQNDFIVRQGLIVQGTGTVTTSTGNVHALQVDSGAGIAGALVVGSDATVWGNQINHGSLSVTGTSYLPTIQSIGGGTSSIDPLTINSTNAHGGAGYAGLITFTNGISGTTTPSKYLRLSSAGDLQIVANDGSTVIFDLADSGLLTLSGALTVGGISTFNNNVSITGANTFTVGTGLSSLGGQLHVTGETQLLSSTAATTGATGALQVTGGAYIGNNLIVASTSSSVSNTASNSIYTLGGVGVSKDLSVGGSLVVTGNFTVLGSQVVVNSTSTAISDPVIDLGTAANNGALTGDDGFNKGLVLHYFDSQDNHMFLGRNNTSGHLVLRNNIDPGFSGVIPNTDYVNSGSYATFDLGTLNAHDTTNASNTTSGALTVAGGAGIGLDLRVGGGVYAATVTAANLTSGQVVFASTDGKLVSDAGLAYSTSTGLVGTITTATNLAGGAAGSVPYQTANGVTAMLSIGTDGEVLTVESGLPAWKSSADTTVGNASFAVTATNVAGGAAHDIPFQSATSSTTFDSGNFTYILSSETLNAPNVAVSGTTNSTGSTNGALTVAGGVGIAEDLHVGGTGTFTAGIVDSAIAGAGDVVFVDANGKLSTNPTVFNYDGSILKVANVTASATVKAATLQSTNLTSGRITYASTNGQLSDSGTLTFSGSTVTIDNGLGGGSIIATGTVTAGVIVDRGLTANRITFAGTGGQLSDSANLTFSGGNLVVGSTGNITAGGTIQGASIIDTGLTAGRMIYVANDQSLVDSANFTFNGTTATVTGLVASNITDSALTSQQVVFAGTAGLLSGSSSLTWDGTTFTASNLSGGNVTASNLNGTTGAAVFVTSGGQLSTDGSAYTYASSLLTVPKIKVTNSTNATSTTTGALQVVGGIAIGQDVWVGGDLNVNGSIFLKGAGLDTITSNTGTFVNVNVTGTGVALTITDSASVGGNLQVTGQTTLGSTTATNFTATSIQATSLTVTGASSVGTLVASGVSTFTNKVNVTSTVDSSSTTTGAVVITGGAGIGGSLTVGGSVTASAFYGASVALVGYTSPTITTNAAVDLDGFAVSTYRTARYTIQVVDGHYVHVSEIIVFHDGNGNAYLNEYGISTTANGVLGTFDATITSGNLELTFTPNYTPTAMVINAVRLGISA